MTGFALTLLQICIIVLAGRAVGLLLKRLGQPTVIGEIAGGILLGPSAFGYFAPDLFARIFPAESIPTLQSLSQIGLILFMFLVGLEFAPELMRGKRRSVIVISHVSIVVPFLLGTALAVYLYPRVSDPGVTFRSFTLFLGTAMSITAFPVLARILAERGLTKTPMGNTVIACAAVDDVTAWCILAFVVVLARSGDPSQLAIQLALVVIFILAMIFVVRPLLRKLAPAKVTDTSLAALLLLVLASSWTTELLGIHALFGAFLAGAIMPREASLNEAIIPHIRGLTSVIFLPLFFAVTGLRTNVGLLRTPELWLCCALVLLVAIAGKLGGATLSARAIGFSWRDATAIGALMNTRGLMEMVVLNIGRDIGVVSDSLFTMCIIMALVTTAMTTPLLDLLVRKSAHEEINASIASPEPSGM
ncbi:MAG: cation:proton antiporter [Acidobacteriota bacterium]|nr:cation:proton antiporter [Acidobacteriota bacterium]